MDDEKCYDEEVVYGVANDEGADNACEKEFDPVKYKEVRKAAILKDINGRKRRKEREQLEDKLCKEALEEVYAELTDEEKEYLPRHAKEVLGLAPESEFVAEKDPYELTGSEEEIAKFKQNVRDIQARQNEIMEIFVEKDKYTALGKSSGYLVSEYKKLEGLKSIYLDKLQAIYNGRVLSGWNNSNNFCEPIKDNGLDRDSRF